MKKTLVVSSILMFAAMAVQAEEIVGKVVGVTDGDTITVLTSDHTQHKVRLYAIDAPETSCHANQPSMSDDVCVEHSQPFGKSAKKNLATKIFGKEVKVVSNGSSSYGRMVGTVYLDGQDMNLAQVSEGYAWIYEQYAKELNSSEYAKYESALSNAKKFRLGLWSGNNPEAPWNYRHGTN